jgi:hypothetical protein
MRMFLSNPGPGSGRERAWKRRGNVIVLSAFLMIVVMAMAAFSVDVGYICLMRGEVQRAVDAAALAGAAELQSGVSEAKEKAKEYLVRNPVGSSVSVISEDWSLEEATQAFDDKHKKGLSMKVGNWNPATRSFEETESLPSSLSVAMEYPNLPFFFGRVLGRDTFTVRGEATAMFQPRDIMVVLDYSASMNDDSEFTAFAKLGQSEVEANLLEIYQDLGSPTYGPRMQFAPRWATVPGVPRNDALSLPHVDVEYRHTSVYVASSHLIQNVKLEFSNGYQLNFAPNALSGTYTGSGATAGKQIVKVWVKSWGNATQFGSNGEYFDFTSSGMNATMKRALGLTSVAYPYPSGSWDAYIDWVENASNQNKNAGYRYKFGYMNWIVWMLETKPGYSQTPDLWKVRAEPISALKASVDVFMDFIASVDTNDRVGLAVYNAPNGEGKLEIALTDVYDPIVQSVNTKQAGHYHQYTNIGAGLHEARLHLDANARPFATKMIVLMTDGNANWRNGQYNEAAANQYLLNEAQLCAAAKYPIMAISLGAAADASIMQQTVDISPGKHFNVPGGSSQQDYYDQLYDVFEEIAKARPIRIVK